jgi:isopenicillin N synthase-like dioxygenase
MKVKTISYRSPNAGLEFAESLRETGFAVLSDHPIAHELIHGSYEEWKGFFASDSKFDYKFDPAKQAGYFPFRTENAKDSSKKDLKEFFHFYPWCDLPMGTRDVTPRLYSAMNSLGSEMLNWIEENTPHTVRRRFSTPLVDMVKGSQDTLLRPLHYPPLTGSEEDGAVRAAAHEDINIITLLPAATVPGLQVKDTAGNWHEVSCDPGTIVINSGDMLKEASGGYYPSTTHQVVNPKGPASKVSRYSMPLFVHARSEVRLSERYTAGAYLNERLQQIGLVREKR